MKKTNGKHGPRVSTGIKMGDIVDTSKIKFAPSPNRGSAYQEVIDRIEKLPVNKSFELPTPQGVSVESFHNRLTMAFQRIKPKLKPGTRMRKGTTLEGNVVISVVPTAKPKGKAKKSKAKASK